MSSNVNNITSSIPIQTSNGLKLSALNPKYLHSNSTSHTWPFSAIAELVDNAYDPDVKASQLRIDLKNYTKTNKQDSLALTFTDNGNGMTPDKLYKMLSFGFCEKVTVKNHVPIGHYGNGFKSGSMRLGKDALVLTKSVSSRSIGFLSQTYLAAVEAETIIVPIVTWNNDGVIEETDEKLNSLPAIAKHSVLTTVQAIDKEFALIDSRTGTRIIISNLRKSSAAMYELDFTEPNDIRIPDDSVFKREERQHHIPASDFSLRAYLAILYLKPRMQIFLQIKKVKTVVIQKDLSKTEVDLYRPSNQKPIKIVFGFSRNINHYGIMMYHRNRLIKPYVRVGCQLKPNNMGVGVIGVIECDSLQPNHTKQDFVCNSLFRLTMSALGQKLNDYWNEKCGLNATDVTVEDINANSDENWAQCDDTNCLKWRRLPDSFDPKSLPEKWFCHMHPSSVWNSCDVPEEEEEPVDNVKPYEKKLKKIERELRQKGAEKFKNNAIDISIERRRVEKLEYEKTQQRQEIEQLKRKMNALNERTFRIDRVESLTDSSTTSAINVGLFTSTPVPRPRNTSSDHPSVSHHLNDHLNDNRESESHQKEPESLPSNIEVNAPPASVPNIKQEEGITKEVTRLRPSRKSSDEGSRKRPIAIDSSDEEEDETNSVPVKTVKVEETLSKETSTKQNRPRTPSKTSTKTTSSKSNVNVTVRVTPKNKGDASNDQEVTPSSQDDEKPSEETLQDAAVSSSLENIEGIDKDILEDIRTKSVPVLSTLLAKRSQALRDLRKKVLTLMETIISDGIEFPDISKKSLEDSTVEELLDMVLSPSGDSDDERLSVYSNSQSDALSTQPSNFF